jgi:SAM-dependent methyltransferase
MSTTPTAAISESPFDDITDGGERITPDLLNWGFYGHLSIYAFCATFSKGARVLDAGCGTGYGCDYLARHGATSVLGVDISQKTIDFCRARYTNPSLSFEVMDLCNVSDITPEQYDIVFCNIGEHLVDVDAFFEFCRRSLAPRGVLLLTVPAIASAGILEGNMRNPYHVTHLVPTAWLAKAARYFKAVQGYRHWLGPHWLDSNNFPAGMSLPPEEIKIRETDFEFIATSGEELNRQDYNISLVILACVPRANTLDSTPAEAATFPDEWNVEAIKRRVNASALEPDV